MYAPLVVLKKDFAALEQRHDHFRSPVILRKRDLYVYDLPLIRLNLHNHQRRQANTCIQSFLK